MIDQLGIRLGPLYLRYYGLILMSGAMAAAWLASREARRRGLNAQHVWDALLWVLTFGIIGARLYHVFTPSPSMGITPLWYFQNPLEILAVWKGGLGIYGGLVGGGLGLWFYARRHKLNFLTWLDIAAPAIALGQAIGRWGNFVNQELYGAPTNLPWAIYIRPENRLPGYEQVAYFHPTFLYESLWNIGATIALLWIARRFAARLKSGDLSLLYFAISPIGRIITELFRLDSVTMLNISLAQILSAAMVGIALTILWFRHKRPLGRPAMAAVKTDPQTKP